MDLDAEGCSVGQWRGLVPTRLCKELVKATASGRVVVALEYGSIERFDQNRRAERHDGLIDLETRRNNLRHSAGEDPSPIKCRNPRSSPRDFRRCTVRERC